VRVGGPNSGHTVINGSGEAIIFRHLPTASILPSVISVIPAGAYLSIPLLRGELELLGADSSRVAIDPHAWVIDEDDGKKEAQLSSSIGSTATGTGAALVRRIGRIGAPSFAKDVEFLEPFIRDTNELLTDALRAKQRVVVEGTQGFGLSLLHGGFYPHCTSRDTTAAGFVSEAGLSPIDVDEIVLVLRSYPIRVAGNSGPLDEITWRAVTEESGSKTPLVEYTSVTKRIRRVGRFDPEVVRRAISYNRPTCIALNHLDYVDAACNIEGRPTQRALEWIRTAELSIGARISLLGCSPAMLIARDVRGNRAQFS
jgi:adenylosuccinate synthase